MLLGSSYMGRTGRGFESHPPHQVTTAQREAFPAVDAALLTTAVWPIAASAPALGLRRIECAEALVQGIKSGIIAPWR
ncbi:hypothetical protein GCM10009835_09740 [Planosporangium flavigriseum]